ncbi:MAG: leucine-rich repeat domain-containing protein [Oscillospiraceae bacterium]|nr:leucine-rich repeat domain-containing protein [Oscillospiraceae bacterium]
MKKLIALIFALTALLCITANAETVGGDCGYYGGPNIQWSYDSETKALSFTGEGIMADYYANTYTPWYKLKVETITVGEGITTLGINTFHFMRGVTSVHLPDTLTLVKGEHTFNGFYDMKELNIPAGLTSLDFLFSNLNPRMSPISPVITVDPANRAYCSENGLLYDKNKTVLYYLPPSVSVENIVLPDSLKVISDYAFYDRSDLKSIDLPEGLISIGTSAFEGCENLTEINLPVGLTELGDSAFEDCSSITAADIPSGVTAISFGLFQGCTSLETVTLPDGITSVGMSAFEGCSKLRSVHIPDSALTVGGSSFRGCSSLESVHLPSGLTYLNDSMFDGCTALKSVELPKGITKIGNTVFNNCRSLEAIVIPEGVTDMLYGGFMGCSNLKSVYLPESLVNMMGGQIFEDCPNLTIYAAPGSRGELYAEECNIPFIAI